MSLLCHADSFEISATTYQPPQDLKSVRSNISVRCWWDRSRRTCESQPSWT